MTRSRRQKESGFALLFVLAAAAIIAIMLYAELPSTAFEAQRQKEEDLITRGEQYKRAIKIYVRQFNRYPASIDDLENTNNIRFLRRRYKDPMTGKDDWRLIHAGGGGFTDSLTMKPTAPAGTTSASDMAAQSAGSPSSSGSTASDGTPQPVQRWQLQRPGMVPNPGATANPDAQGDNGDQPDQPPEQALPFAQVGAQGQPQPGDGTAPGTVQPGEPGYAPGNVQPGQPGYQPTQPGMVGYQGTNQPGYPQGTQPGQRSYRPGVPAYGSPTQPLYPPMQLPGMPSNLVSNPGAAAVNNQLAGGSSQSSSSSSGGMFGSMPGAGSGGIAGVASKSEAEGIKIYKKHSKYKEWEFIYDPRQDVMTQLGMMPNQPGGSGGIGGAPGAPLGTQVGTSFGQSGQTVNQQVSQPGTSGPGY